jgi:hypothetical protein
VLCVRGAEEAIHVHGAMMAAAELRARQGSIQAINPSGVGADRRAGRAGGWVNTPPVEPSRTRRTRPHAAAKPGSPPARSCRPRAWRGPPARVVPALVREHLRLPRARGARCSSHFLHALWILGPYVRVRGGAVVLKSRSWSVATHLPFPLR